MAKKVAKTVPNITDMVEKMKSYVESATADSNKFDNGTNDAGARVRKVMQEIKGMCKEIRDAITEVKNIRKDQ
jgi:methyl-accepting chemotaxis protein